jgi:dolichyl-phosphate beta-glucosyltransferase
MQSSSSPSPADGPPSPPAGSVVVVPCFNEASRLPGEAFLACVADMPRVRFLFVDDGSRDGTAELLATLRSRAPHAIDVLVLPDNVGKAEAVRHGVLHALGGAPRFVGYWDADLATPLEELTRFIDVLERRADVVLVMGARVALLGRDIRRSPLRHYLGRAFATAASWMLGLRVYDTQCGAKLLRADRVREGVFVKPFVTRWLLDIEILQRVRRLEGLPRWPAAVRCIHEQPLDSWRDVRGSKLSLRQMLRAGLDLVRLTVRPSDV